MNADKLVHSAVAGHLATRATGAAVLAGLDAVGELLAGKAVGLAQGNRFADAPVVKDAGR